LQVEEKKRAGESWGPKTPEYSNLVFTTKYGGPIHPRNFDRVWYKLMEDAKVRRIRFHDLRHMHVSLLNKVGMDARTIADRIGHTDPAFTIRRYAHVFEEQRRAAAIPLLELLSPRSDEPN
jgi:integrase